MRIVRESGACAFAGLSGDRSKSVDNYRGGTFVAGHPLVSCSLLIVPARRCDWCATNFMD